jgi:hypothetical protein
MFGCAERLEISATLWTIYGGQVGMFEDKDIRHRVHTSLTFRGSPPGYILTRLIRTFEPFKVPL